MNDRTDAHASWNSPRSQRIDIPKTAVVTPDENSTPLHTNISTDQCETGMSDAMTNAGKIAEEMNVGSSDQNSEASARRSFKKLRLSVGGLTTGLAAPLLSLTAILLMSRSVNDVSIFTMLVIITATTVTVAAMLVTRLIVLLSTPPPSSDSQEPTR